jgi:hypothetical protein
MKATKLVMITALVSFALMSFANAELGMSKNVISLKTAMQSPQLVAAIYSQVNPADIFNSERAGTYTAQVVLKKTVYLINGTFNEWNLFFRDIDGRNAISNNLKKPASLNDVAPVPIIKNPFSTSGTRVNPFSTSKKHPSPYSEKDPFGEKGKKPLPSKKDVKGMMDWQ